MAPDVGRHRGCSQGGHGQRRLCDTSRSPASASQRAQGRTPSPAAPRSSRYAAPPTSATSPTTSRTSSPRAPSRARQVRRSRSVALSSADRPSPSPDPTRPTRTHSVSLWVRSLSSPRTTWRLRCRVRHDPSPDPERPGPDGRGASYSRRIACSIGHCQPHFASVSRSRPPSHLGRVHDPCGGGPARCDVFDSAWLFDHFYPVDGDGSCFEVMTAPRGADAACARHQVGHLVLANPYRHPALAGQVRRDHRSHQRRQIRARPGRRLARPGDHRVRYPARPAGPAAA